MKMKEKTRQIIRFEIVFIVLAAVLVLALLANIAVGSVGIPLDKLFRALFTNSPDVATEHAIIMKFRLPRLTAAALLGGALGVSGFLIQTYFRNPIASPFVLGISSGAKMVLAVFIIVLTPQLGALNSWVRVAATFVGSLLSMGFVLLCSRKMKSMSMLLVIGIMIGYICSAVTDFLITFAKESDITNLTIWSMGSFSGIQWDEVLVIATVVLTSLACAMLLSKPISAFQLGEGYAQSMGLNVKLFRILLIILTSILSSCVVAFAGPVSFVGIAVPHVTKLMLKTSKPIVVIPATFLCGSAFCLICDLIARTVFSPTEMAISTVTAVFGAPVVIWMLLKRKKEN